MNNDKQIICPLCNDAVDKLLYRFHIDSEKNVIDKIRKEHPGWTETDGLCSRCVDYYHAEIVMRQRILPAIGPYFPVKSVDDFVILPTPLRVDADPRYTGKGVTICFVDSGFYPHPDLKNRIKIMIDICAEAKPSSIETENESAAWHGTMTSVVCAGDGFLSKGLYKGIASDANLVLLKVQDEHGKITTANIIKALEWILTNHKEYDIKIVNLSLGDDEAVSYKESRVDQLAEKLIEEGISVVAAVGNDEHGYIHPPANALNVIAVGGVDDDNKPGNEFNTAYHSSYGKTVDELMKPELVAHAIWVAAPILPGSTEQEEAVILHRLLSVADAELQMELEKNISKIKLDHSVLSGNDLSYKRLVITRRIQEAKYILPHYMHVDGTSFSAPIVSAVIAQLLEARPELTPQHIRQILFGSAKRIPGIDAERQGFGMIQPRKAILKVLKREWVMSKQQTPFVNHKKQTIEFYLHHDCAEQISLAGSFNQWAEDILLMEPGKNGYWKIEIPLLPEGRYHYKFFVDSNRWVEDVDNPYREPDGYSGFNSILIIQPAQN
ncbi:MAG: S8 family serine peptidase [Bacteroidetes bacterium]|nr:S8 family serine peptidase [Bacteroidota bacterium]